MHSVWHSLFVAISANEPKLRKRAPMSEGKGKQGKPQKRQPEPNKVVRAAQYSTLCTTRCGEGEVVWKGRGPPPVSARHFQHRPSEAVASARGDVAMTRSGVWGSGGCSVSSGLEWTNENQGEPPLITPTSTPTYDPQEIKGLMRFGMAFADSKTPKG